jgi:phage terminase large subunit
MNEILSILKILLILSNFWKGGATVMWNPRALIGEWTPDQKRVAAHFPEARRVCVCAANGVGKTYLAADIVVSFLMDFPSALVLFTAPTQRQVEQLLWPEIVRRLKRHNLMPTDEAANRPEWKLEQGGTLYGFATNQPERMQGFHAPNMLIVVDEASGMTAELLEAMEAVAIGANNYIFAIGNPNELYGPFYHLTHMPCRRGEMKHSPP